MSRILITGASGLLGAHLMAGLTGRHEVLGIDRHPWWGDRPSDLRAGDLSDVAFINKILRSFAPQILIHCAAMANVDACEENPALAYAENSDLTRALVRAASVGSLFVYISTDGIFEGEKPFATEEDTPSPRTVYGRSKLRGEWEVKEAAARHLIVRTNFYGWSSGRKKTFAEWLYRALENGEEITLFNDFFFTPLYVADLVARLHRLIETGTTGTLHVAARERISKSDFGLQLAKWAGFSTRHVRIGSLRQAPLAAPRPSDMSLGCQRFTHMTGLSLPSAEEGLRRFLEDRGRPLSERSKALTLQTVHG